MTSRIRKTLVSSSTKEISATHVLRKCYIRVESAFDGRAPRTAAAVLKVKILDWRSLEWKHRNGKQMLTSRNGQELSLNLAPVRISVHYGTQVGTPIGSVRLPPNCAGSWLSEFSDNLARNQCILVKWVDRAHSMLAIGDDDLFVAWSPHEQERG